MVAVQDAPPITYNIAVPAVPVFPGDVFVGDAEGVVVIPRHLADEVAEEAVGMTDYEDWVMMRVLAGDSIVGIYPAKGDARERFQAWVEAGKPGG